jgi:hypothetical protein
VSYIIPQPVWRGVPSERFPNSIVPTPENGQWRFAERIYYTQEVEGPYYEPYWSGTNWIYSPTFVFAQAFVRGSLWILYGFDNYFYVEDTQLVSSKGGKAKVTTTFAWTGSVPPPEWSITPFELNPPIVRNVFYSGLWANTGTEATDAERMKALQDVWNYYQTSNSQQMVMIKAALDGNPSFTAIQNSLLRKMLLGQETFYLAGLKYVLTAYYTDVSGLDFRGGGFRESPSASPDINGSSPYHLVPNNGSIYTDDSTYAYLREADECVWNNGLYKVTRSWIGAPQGFWDTDLYGTTPI